MHHVFHLIAYGGIVGRDELLRMLQAVVKVSKIISFSGIVCKLPYSLGRKVESSNKT